MYRESQEVQIWLVISLALALSLGPDSRQRQWTEERDTRRSTARGPWTERRAVEEERDDAGVVTRVLQRLSGQFTVKCGDKSNTARVRRVTVCWCDL